ncbi:probable peptidyl-tRNA hydrolase 2 [Toxorhynchites rutilus septentrionalis]|uniref:probable peptidyl-tRNA hydrolase 2 n=1 Tax=Toxorhynchites rutilus septentrionalis TaxID=329112 RepID=UPI0024793708|nr:probable peptidyl-tRNA hydrolase 2 [Toxorhynchites rutilus septentrionalis]
MMESAHIYTVVAVLGSFLIGYKYGNRMTKSKPGKKSEPEEKPPKQNENVFSDFGGEYKMILVVRNDLKMGKGKIAAQCGHAAVGAYEGASKKTPTILRKWQHTGQAKIAVKVDSEQQMMEVYKTAKANNLNCCLIRDAGRTQIEPNSKTVLAIGPAPNEVIDLITGHLKLL